MHWHDSTALIHDAPSRPIVGGLARDVHEDFRLAPSPSDVLLSGCTGHPPGVFCLMLCPQLGGRAVRHSRDLAALAALSQRSECQSWVTVTTVPALISRLVSKRAVVGFVRRRIAPPSSGTLCATSK